jgi:ATP-dependent helicase YprA (DUF1998 family)
MSEPNPLAFRDRLEATLRRYIQTAVPISHRYPRLKAQMEKVLAEEADLVKGPYLETLPDFVKGCRLNDLIQQGLFSERWLRLPSLLLERRLHQHQEEAFLAALEKDENFLVATGTGSGKTECFLYPLVERLLRDPNPAEPGVRILLVYPLNALANDQLYFRLAPLKGSSRWFRLFQAVGGPGSEGRLTSRLELLLCSDAQSVEA